MTKACIQQLHDAIKGQSERIESLESEVVILENYLARLESSVDDQEQYQRRLCLKIDGIPPAAQGKEESCEQCLKSFFHDPHTAALDMNHDLNLIKLWAHSWRMSFNPDPTKQAVEVTFSKKRIQTNHPPIFF